jgi:predicted ABC-type ATPase
MPDDMLENMKPVLAVIAGPNGSGKTTITEALLRHEWLQGCEYINPNNIARDLGDWKGDNP